MPRHIYAKDHPIPGEVWRNTPCGNASVSDQGRLKNLAGELVKAFSPRKGENPAWHVRNSGRSRRYIPASLVAQVFLGGSGGMGGKPRFKNGDPSDWRASNLDIGWTEIQDEIIRAAPSCRAAARALGMGRGMVRTRARALGKVWPRTVRTGVRPLVDRIDVVKRAVAVLEAAGVGDRRINLALRIDGRKVRGLQGVELDPGGQDECVRKLHEAGWAPDQIGEALGWLTGAVAARMKLRDLGLLEPTGWAGNSRAGWPEEVEGEIWREHSSGNWVSNLGRVVGPRGLLAVARGVGHHPRVTIATPDGPRRHTTITVAQLMLDAFRPGMRYTKKLLINGDINDVRLANIRVPSVGQSAVAEVRRLIPGYFHGANRDDTVQAAVLALIEGRATTAREAVKIAVQEVGALIDTKRHLSLDAEMGGGGSLHDFLTDAGAIQPRERRRAGRARG